MVIDGIYYALALAAGGGVVSYFAGPAFGIPLYLLAAFCLWFFRDPERDIPPGEVAVSPADGKVLAVSADGADRMRIGIFMNVFDVHVNRFPVSGEVDIVHYNPGEFFTASLEKASLLNEQASVGIVGPKGPLVVRQIAGLVARRIVTDLAVGREVRRADRIGMIKFGSRVELLVPNELIGEVRARVGQRVKAAVSILFTTAGGKTP